jgi:beta-glucosidase
MSSPVGKQVHWTFDPNAAAGTAYTATGLPPGITLDASGRVTGAATVRGTSTVTVRAKNSAGATGAATFVWTTT